MPTFAVNDLQRSLAWYRDGFKITVTQAKG
jgi:catechol 2,3-dioxygenase-like lactoylglutathione lyase family enzyme